MNGDGDLDLVAVFDTNRINAEIDGGLWIFPGKGDSTFGTGTCSIFTCDTILAAALTIAIGDVNGYGRPDIVFAIPHGSHGSIDGPLVFGAGKRRAYLQYYSVGQPVRTSPM